MRVFDGNEIGGNLFYHVTSINWHITYHAQRHGFLTSVKCIQAFNMCTTQLHRRGYCHIGSQWGRVPMQVRARRPGSKGGVGGASLAE